MNFEGRMLGRYSIVRLIGRGGAGDVYLAEDQRITRRVAIKIIKSQETTVEQEKEAIRLFEREARAIAQLNHPHVLPLFDFGEENLDGAAVTYLVTPFCPDGSLLTWLHNYKRSPILLPQEVVPLLQQAADALEYAHEQGIIHRDVKPSNFLVRTRKSTPAQPDLLLADFGIARIIESTINVTQTIRGTPAYMSPEQWRGESTYATDQYALAVMTYELLTGRQPFQGTQQQMMYHHCMTQPQPPSTINKTLSQEIDNVILRALAKNSKERFSSVASFATAFAQMAQKPLSSGDLPIISSTPVSSSTPVFAPEVSSIPAENKKESYQLPPASPVLSADLHTTLAISSTDAVKGVQRSIYLPNGQVIPIQISPGAYDGQQFYLEKQVEPTQPSAPKKNLVVDLAIVPNSEPVMVPIPGLRPSIFRSRILLSLTLIVAILVASIIGFFTFGTPITSSAVQATAIASKATLQAVDASSTAAARMNNQQATATAQYNATATVLYNPYNGTHKTLALYNQAMSENTAMQWDKLQNLCVFTPNGYHVLNTGQTIPGHICTANQPHVTDLSFEADMTLIKGHGAGIALSINSTQTYDFYLNTDRTYSLLSCRGTSCKTLLSGYSSWIIPGMQQTNLVALVIDNGSLSIYANKYYIDSIQSNALPNAHIGLTSGAQSEAVFQNVRVWTA